MTLQKNSYFLFAMALINLACTKHRPEITVFHAASLSRSFHELSLAFKKIHPETKINLAPSGSLTAARKISELNMRADIVASADIEVLEKMLMPKYASWSLAFATNEIVLAHQEHSPFTEEIHTQNWYELLLRDKVRLGCVDPNMAPLGYRTHLVWKLTEKNFSINPRYLGFYNALRQKCTAEQTRPDESELIRLLMTRAIDFAFVYRSTAEELHLKFTRLQPTCNLSDPNLSSIYAKAKLEVNMRTDRPKTKLTGKPIVYGITIPKNAVHAKDAYQFVRFMFSKTGIRILKKSGYNPLVPPQSSYVQKLPPELKKLIATQSRP